MSQVRVISWEREYSKKSLEITKRERNLKIVESVEKHGYNQKEVADYLGFWIALLNYKQVDEKGLT